jgi:methylmalonyl-CoA mutase
MVVAGGVIPYQDHDFLHNAGFTFFIGPVTVITNAPKHIITKLLNGPPA